MTHFEWPRPEWWQSVAPSTERDALEVMGLTYSLRAARSESVLEFLRSLNFSETDLPAPALGAYPLTADEVEAFLKTADALLAPSAAAVRMTERLIALDTVMNEAVLALNILDVWRHCHALVVDSRHAEHCSCLMECSQMPQGIRALDEALQTYYEHHHQQPAPECFGSADRPFRQSLRPLIRRCLDGA